MSQTNISVDNTMNYFTGQYFGQDGEEPKEGVNQDGGNMSDRRVEMAHEDKTKEIVNEIISRERYRYDVDSTCSKFFTFCLRNVDMHMQKVKKNGQRKLEKEMDFTWIIKQVRN